MGSEVLLRPERGQPGRCHEQNLKPPALPASTNDPQVLTITRYDFDHLRNWLRRRQIVPRIVRRGVETSSRLDKHRWVVERTMSWLNGCRQLLRRYERKAEHFLALRGLGQCPELAGQRGARRAFRQAPSPFSPTPYRGGTAGLAPWCDALPSTAFLLSPRHHRRDRRRRVEAPLHDVADDRRTDHAAGRQHSGAGPR